MSRRATSPLTVRATFFAGRAPSARSGLGARSGWTERRAHASRTRGRSRLAMEQGAPAAVVFAAGLTAASWVALYRNCLVVEGARGRSVRRAPAHVENLQTRIGIGVAGGTVRPSDGRCIPDGLRQ